MSNSTFTSRKKQLLEKRKANLEARYETVFKQLDATLNESDKFTLKQQLELLESEIEEIDGALKNISENGVQEQLETEINEIEGEIENISEIKLKKIFKVIIILSSLLIVGLLTLGLLNFQNRIQIEKEREVLVIEKEQEALVEEERQAIQQIEKELNIRLKKLDEIEWYKKGYVLNEKGQVVGLSLFSCNIQNIERIITPMKDLIQLTQLSLYGNWIRDISPLKGLIQLTVLILSDNQIVELTPLKSLTQLTELYLSRNEIRELTPLKSLVKLQNLYLPNNPIEELPVWITDFDMEIKWTNESFEGITFYNNPLKSPPVEIVKQGKEAIKQYFEQLETQDN